jgi:hypothetical protein
MKKPRDLPEAEERLTMTVPPRVMREIKRRAFERDSTVRAIVLHALKADGISVDEAALRDRRGSLEGPTKSKK